MKGNFSRSIVAPPLVYVAVVFLGGSIGCLLPGSTCKLGATIPPFVSLLILFLGISLVAFTICFLVGVPLIKVLRMANLEKWWAVVPLSALVGLLPMVLFCISGRCVHRWHEYIICGLAGAATGSYYLVMRRRFQ